MNDLSGKPSSVIIPGANHELERGRPNPRQARPEELADADFCAPASRSMGATRVRLPFGGCASTEAEEVQMPGLSWLVWAAIVAGCLFVWLLV